MRFDDDAFAEDVAHAGAAGRAVGERERRRLERDGIASMLLCIAFGLRHPRAPWQPSVYQVAHRRLHGQRDSADAVT